MSTPQSNARIAPRIRVSQATRLTALSVLVAIFLSVLVLALVHTNHTVGATPFKVFAPTSAPHVHRLGR